ncbi:MAG: hypothetical protein ACKOWD_01485 [Rhodoferax sp.]
MKKLSSKRRLFQLKKSRDAIRRRQKLNGLRKSPRTYASKSQRERGTLVAPSHFVIYSKSGGAISREIDEFFRFLKLLRETTASDLLIDMSGVKRMVVDAALLFKAELSRLIEVGKTRIKTTPPSRDRTLQVLKQTGMDRLLNLNIEGSPSREDVVHWRIAEGPSSTVDSSALNLIMTDIEEVSGLESHPVYQGIIESMANCVEHAYKPHHEVSRIMPTSPGWWVFQQVREGTLHVVVCDLGIGIRRSLPLTLAGEETMYKKLMHLYRRTKGEDNRALLAAMEYGRSSTGQKQRGKGMRNAHKVVDDLGEGTFFALSNAGCYTYHRNRRHDIGRHTTVKLRHSIHGTILGWRLPLNSSNSEASHD